MGFDPAQLLRRSWSGEGGVDELARELYVMFTGGQPYLAPAVPSVMGAISPESTALKGFGDRQQRAVYQAKQQARRAIGVPPFQNPPSVQPSRPDAHRVPTQQLPRPAPAQSPSVAVAPSAPAARAVIPPAVQEPQENFRDANRGRPTAAALASPGVPPGPSGATPAVPPAVAPLAPAVRPGVESAPVQAPEKRQIVTPGATALPALGAAAAIAQQIVPGFFAAPVVLAGAVPSVPVAARQRSVVESTIMPTTLAQATEAPRKPTSTAPRIPRGAREWPALGFDQKAIGWVLPAGVTGMNPNGSGETLATPGQGQFYLLEFDPGTGLTYGQDRSPTNCYNLSIFPVAGNTFGYMVRIGEYFFLAHRFIFAHAIVTSQINPCGGTTPGQGKAQVYYMSNGSMTAGPTLSVENWYSVTAAVGKHCGLVEVDGTAGLEVLDC